MSVVLSEQLPLLINAPDGVQKLRGLILELAMRGKLVPQDGNDEPASDLLKRVAQERARLEVEGVCKKSKPLPSVAEDEQPFAVPSTWEWVRLATVASFENGDRSKNYPSRDEFVSSGIPFINAGHLHDRRVDFSNMNFIPFKLFDALRAGKTRQGDILFCLRGSLGKFGVVRTAEPGAIASSLVIVRAVEGDLLGYLELYLASPVASAQISRFDNGTAQPNLSAADLAKFVLPLPPVAEQQRIVAKVGELMVLCDQLEAEQAEVEEGHDKLVETLLGTLTQSTNATDLAANWQRIAEHFESFFTTESSIDILKQTVLQLAVIGKLVPQDPNDEPASGLLARIARVRAQPKAEVAQKKTGNIPVRQGVGLPSGWSTATLPELCAIGGGATPSKAKSVYWGEGLPWVSPKDMKVEHIFDAQDHVTELALDETRLPRVPSGSLLIVVRGMILVHSFPIATTQVEVAINQDMKSLTAFIPEMQPFLALALRGWKQHILSLVDRSTHGTCKLQSEKLFAFQIGIPPLAEQHRIVTKVDELMTVCERLKTDLADSRHRQARLASTLIESALKVA